MSGTNDFERLLGALRNTEPYIADAGFSAAVSTRLATTRRLPGWLANLILLAFTAIGSALAAWLTDPGMQLTSAIPQALTSLLSAQGVFFLPTIAVAAAGMLLLACMVIWLSESEAI